MDKKQDHPTNLNHLFAAQVLYYLRGNDRAKGITFDTWFIKGLATFAFLAYRKQVENNLNEAAFLNEVVSQCQTKAKELSEKIGDLPLEEQRDALVEVHHLQRQAQRAVIRLERLKEISNV